MLQEIFDQIRGKNLKVAFPECEDEQIRMACKALEKQQLCIPVFVQEGIEHACNMLISGEIDGIVYGACHTTAETLRPALKIIKAQGTASSFFIMIKNKEVLFFADCGFNVKPTSEQLADIALSTAASALLFGVKPYVAMLSFSTKGSAQHDDVEKVVRATTIVQKKNPKLLIDGEIQFDAAYDSIIAKRKCPESPIVGNANVFIFPDLNSGNIAYKIAERLGGYQAIGPILQGFTKPINDLSRGCSVGDIIAVAAITCLQGLRLKAKN